MKIKNVMLLLLIALSFALVGCDNVLTSDLTEMENGTSRSIEDNEILNYWNLGTGRNSLTGKKIGFAYTEDGLVGRDSRDFLPVREQFTYITDAESHSKFMSTFVSVDGSLDIGGFEADASFESKMNNSISYSEQSSTLIVTIEELKNRIWLTEPGDMNERALSYRNYPELFIEQYGDSYLSEVVTGASLFYIFRATIKNSEETTTTDISAALKLKYRSLFELNAEVEFEEDEIALFESCSYSIEYLSHVRLNQSENTIDSFDERTIIQKGFQDAVDVPDFEPYIIKKAYNYYPSVLLKYQTNLTNLKDWQILRSEIYTIWEQYLTTHMEIELYNDCKTALEEIDLILANFEVNATTTPLADAQKYDHILNYFENKNILTDVTKDFNGDGYSDKYVFNSSNGTHFVYLNNGDGIFSSNPKWESASSMGQGYTSQIGYFNNDKIPDIYISRSVDGYHATWINNGDGSFPETFNWAAGPDYGNNYEYQIGDFNDDKVMDIYLSRSGGGIHATWINNGDGSFPATYYWVSEENYGTNYEYIVGDYNGDEIMDIYLFKSEVNNATWINNGDGTFPSTYNY